MLPAVFYFIFFWGRGGGSEGFGQGLFSFVVQPTRTVHGKSTHPAQPSSGVFGSFWDVFPFPRSCWVFFFVFFLPLGTPPSFESAGLEGYNPLIHKAQSIFFRRRFGEKEKKRKKPRTILL